MVLPEGIKGTKVWGYTGTRGAQGEDYRAEVTETGATIEATRPFGPKENLTVMLEWHPGLLDRRAYEDRAFLTTCSPVSTATTSRMVATCSPDIGRKAAIRSTMASTAARLSGLHAPLRDNLKRGPFPGIRGLYTPRSDLGAHD